MFAKTPKPPYIAVIFSNQLTTNTEGYDDTAATMVEMASDQPGFLGIESVRDSAGQGITISYWQSEADIKAWKANMDHQKAQDKGKRAWYEDYITRVATVYRDYTK